MLTQPGAKIAVQSKTGEATFHCGKGERLLYAGLANGLSLPYECATGTCGTCRGRVVPGSVVNAWPEAPGAARLKADKGDILLCQSVATDDCVVRVAANVTASTSGPMPIRQTGRVICTKRLTADVMHVELELATPMPFAAGQFVVVEAPGVTGGRAYSMVNYDEETSVLVFVIKRKPGGAFGDWLFETDATGAELSLFGPLGKAVWKPDEQRGIVAIAGGSGIAGIMSILEHATRSGHFNTHRGQVFFGVRTLADAFYVEALSKFAAEANGNLAITLALSHEQVDDNAMHAGLKLAHGFVHDVARQSLGGGCGDVTAFLAGPGPMVDGALRMLLTDARLTVDRIRYDKFG